MISQDRDYEDILRDALRAAAESVEPAGNGLERIRHRSHSRRSARSTLARAADWLRLYRIRLSVRLESFRWELSQRGIGQSPTGPDHDGRTPVGKTAARLGPAAAWLKPAFAVAAVVAVVVVGVIHAEPDAGGGDRADQLGHLTGPAARAGRRHRPGQPGLVAAPCVSRRVCRSPRRRRRTRHSPLPEVACTQTPTPSALGAERRRDEHSLSPTPSNTATASPTPSPSDSATVSPTADPGQQQHNHAALRHVRLGHRWWHAGRHLQHAHPEDERRVLAGRRPRGPRSPLRAGRRRGEHPPAANPAPSARLGPSRIASGPAAPAV